MVKQIFIIITFFSLTCGKYAAGQWVKIADLPNSPFTDLYFIDGSIGFTIGHEFIYKTIDGGYTWDTTQLGTDSDILYEFDFIHRDTGFIVGEVSGSRAFVTYNQGETWNSIEPYAFSTEVSIVNANEFLWCVNGTPGIRRYNVLSGLEQSHDPGIIVEDIQVFSQDTIYVGGGGFSRSFDGGENWELIEGPGIIWMDFPNSRVGYSAADSYYKTIDFGETWEEIEIPFYFDGCSVPEIISDSIGYFPCVYDGTFDYHGIAKTVDGGYSWIFNESVPPLFEADAIGKIFCLSQDSCWCVTYTGQIYFTSNGGGETLPPTTIKINEEKQLLTILPNPASDNIEFSLEASYEEFIIEIYNLYGGKIDSFTLIQNYNWNCSNLVGGIYAYKLIKGERQLGTGLIIIQ